MNEDVRICGAGLAGATIARLCAEAGYKVNVYERRAHIGGQCYDSEMAGVLVHNYGPHYFRTDSPVVMAFLSRFTDWLYYPCVAKVNIGDQLVPFPVNMATLEALYDIHLTVPKCRALLEWVTVPSKNPQNVEQVILSTMGRRVYEHIYKGYTRKQWGMEPSELSASIGTRYPVRMNRNGSYYDGYRWHDLLPARGYTEMIHRILNHPLICVTLNQQCPTEPGPVLVWTGPLDAYYAHRYGPLPYRSLSFEFRPIDFKVFSCLQVNYPDPELDLTRIVEYDGFGRGKGNVVWAVEYPSATGDPYYPIPTRDNEDLAERYKAIETDTIFCGRLAEYKYLYMDETVLHAFRAFGHVKEQLCI